DFDLARGGAIRGGFTLRAHQTDFHEGGGPTLFGADFISFVFGPVAHVWPKSAGSADGSRLGHAPKMFDLQAKTVEAADEFERRRGASTNNADRRVEFPEIGRASCRERVEILGVGVGVQREWSGPRRA